MTVEILCTALCDVRAKSEGAVSKNVFYKNGPHGGARRGPCEKCGLWFGRQGVCVQSLAWIGATVAEI